MRQVKLDLASVRPVDPIQTALWPLQPLVRRALEALAEDDERRVPQEDQPPTRPQQARRLRDPAVGVGPDRRAVLGQGEVERGVRQRDVLPHCLDERKLEPELLLHGARRRKLCGRRIDAHGPRAALREPGREVGGAASELDDVETGDVAEDADFRLRDLEDAPVDLVLLPCPPSAFAGVLGVCLRPDSTFRGT